MNLEQLNCLIAVVEEGSISAGARRLNLTHRSQLESLENILARRENLYSFSLFFMQTLHERDEIWLFKLAVQRIFPTVFYLDIHYLKMNLMTSSIFFT